LHGVHTSHRVAGPLVGFVGLVAVLACEKEVSRPPDLGDCNAEGDANCVSPVTGGGAGGGSGGGDSGSSGNDGGGIGDVSAASCADGGALIVTGNAACEPCIANSCCTYDIACTNDVSCSPLVQCAQNCSSGDSACVMSCESLNSMGVAAYYNLSTCLFANCNTVCPLLPQPSPGDP